MKFHCYNPPKALPCAEPRRLSFSALKSQAVGDWKNQKSSKHAYGYRVANMGVYISRIWGEETP